MQTTTDPDAVRSRRLAAVAAGVVYLAVVVVSWRGSKRWKAWWKRNSLLARPTARLERMERTYRRRNQAVGDFGKLRQDVSTMGKPRRKRSAGR